MAIWHEEGITKQLGGKGGGEGQKKDCRDASFGYCVSWLFVHDIMHRHPKAPRSSNGGGLDGLDCLPANVLFGRIT